MNLRVEDPTSGQIIELPATPFEAGATAIPLTAVAAKQDKDGDQVLTAKDRPDGIEPAEWSAYLKGLADWAKMYPAALAAVTQLRAAEGPVVKMGADIQQRLAAAATNDRFTVLRDALLHDGIQIVPTQTVIRGEGTVHELSREGQPDKTLPFTESFKPEKILLRARMAMGVLPAEAQAFAAQLGAEGQHLLVRLFTDGAVAPEDPDVRYGARADNLYRLANSMTSEDDALVMSFGNDFGNGPGRLTLRNDGGALRAGVVFELFGSRETQLVFSR